MLLDSYLDQIAVSARSIGDLEFPPSKAFTNALLGQYEITTLIRDTEPHERALFTVDPNLPRTSNAASARKSVATSGDGLKRRKTINQLQQKQGSAVAKVLGNEMLRQIQQSSRGHGRSRGVDVEVLLQGAERLCAVYPITGVKERAAKIRTRYAQVTDSLVQYETLVVKQQLKLSKQNDHNQNGDSLNEVKSETKEYTMTTPLTEDDLRIEEENIRELETRKKALEDRVAGMEKDLGGLLC